MTRILEADEEGALHLPAELLGEAKPHSRYELEVQGDILILRPEKPQPFWATATPQERAEAFRQWALSHKTGPGLPDEALRRENMYD